MCYDKEPLKPHHKLVRLIETGKTCYLEECEDTKHKKRLIFTFDLFLSLFVVAPLIIANWRGTWCLMDVYMDFFPEYETFLFSNAIYLGCTIIKGVLKDNVRRYRFRYGKSHVWKGLAKLYICCFNIIGNMLWRAGFMIFDILCGIETDELGNAYPDNDLTATIYLIIVCTLLLVVFKSLRNVTSVPFVIALDRDHDEIYDFPTRFRVEFFISMPTTSSRWSSEFGLYKYDDLKRESTATKFVVIVTSVGIIVFTVFYLCIFLLKNAPETNTTTIKIQEELITEPESMTTEYPNITITPEKLISGINLGLSIKQPPSPFINHIRGPSPASFITSPTEKMSSNLPQLQNYARPGYPRNIQDIINYISSERPNHESPRKPIAFPKHHDPFFPYKPKDPSDINLMATANLRFAPPSWKEIKTNLIPSQSLQKPETRPQEKIKRPPKALTLSLNIFPMANDVNHQNFYGFTSNANPKFVGNGRRRPRKMIIHLNVYGNDELFEREDDEPLGNVQDQDLVLLRDLASDENDFKV